MIIVDTTWPNMSEPACDATRQEHRSAVEIFSVRVWRVQPRIGRRAHGLLEIRRSLLESLLERRAEMAVAVEAEFECESCQIAAFGDHIQRPGQPQAKVVAVQRDTLYPADGGGE